MKKRVRGATGWGVVVRRLREERGWSQGQLADHAEVDQSQISKIESGVQEDARLSTVTGLAGALGVTPDTLLGLRPAGPPHLRDEALPGPVLEQRARLVRAELDRALRPRRRGEDQQPSDLALERLATDRTDYRYLNAGALGAFGRLVRAAAPVP